ncbi:hypothetical protein [Parvularcula sp. LCG005]|uniref:hypothetical protein n=1 Tax=Parvularcula sp. LCG005 TaxID=3078805 RepID=UPI00294347D5|nr:hypothetical protein [Parvularcula sp. LCG005]WOI53832.1 hypothetical protein RUI03_02250 [Parvularcula sp. LCG005]
MIGCLSLYCGYVLLSLPHRSFEDVTASTLPQHRGSAYYRALGMRAAARGDLALAHRAAQLETKAAPNAPAAWHRLAHAAAAQNGAPDREALGALLQAYAVAPYVTPSEMEWRVAFAATYWNAVPDSLLRLTVSQIDAMGTIEQSWEVRQHWCRTLPDGALADAACATTPNIQRR